MKIKVYEKEIEKTKEITVTLKEESIGGVVLYVVDARGEKIPGGNILELRPDGTLHLIKSINSDLGFRLDAEGKIHLA